MGQTAIDGVEGLQETGELDGLHDLRQLMWGHSLLLVCAVLYVSDLVVYFLRLLWRCLYRPKIRTVVIEDFPHTEKCRGLPRLSEVSHCC